MEKKAILIFNPSSGKDQVSKEELLERISLHLEDFDVAVFEIIGENVHPRLTDFISKLDPSLIIVAGGDGSVKLTSSCLKTRIPIAILPLGSANGLARCLRIRNLADGLEALRNLEIYKMDGIQIDGELCLHLADFGFNANLINKFEEGDKRGMLGYIKSSISEVFNTKTCRFEIKGDGESLAVNAKMLVIANGEEYGTGAVINTEGRMNDGKFEVIAVEFKSAGDLISITKGLVTGENQEQSTVKTWSFETCTIFNLDGANFQIDGELRGNPESVFVKILKGAFDFVIKS